MQTLQTYSKKREKRKKRLGIFNLLWLGMFLVSLAGCSSEAENRNLEQILEAEAPVYERNILQFQFPEDANLYMTDYGKNGFFYYAANAAETAQTPQTAEESSDYEMAYQFFYQAYDNPEAVPFGTITDGIVRGFSGVERNGKEHLAVFQIGEKACITEFDESGKLCRKTALEDEWNQLTEISRFLARPDGDYLISMAEQLFFLDSDARITGKLKLEGIVDKWLVSEAQELFALVQKNTPQNNTLQLVKLDVAKKQAELTLELPNDLIDIFAFEDGFLSIFANRAVFSRTGKGDEEVLLDLDKQNLPAFQIQYIQGNREEIKIVSIHPSPKQEGYFIVLRKPADSEAAKRAERSEEGLYAPDGRRMVHVAVPKKYPYQIEYHAKIYNQTSEKGVVEIERFEDSLETYLGKGNRPDIILFQNQTELGAYLQKDALVDFLPLFAAQDNYSLDGVIPKARELLGAQQGDGMYAMAGRFRLLLRTSDGTEYSADGTCDAVQYLNWYDRYLMENEISGMGAMENFLYANVSFFYDENTAEASFDSAEFKNLMRAYKDIYDRFGGASGQTAVSAEKGYQVQEIAAGPRWYASYSRPQLSEPNVSMEGIPGPDGKNHVYMRLDYPMSILNTSGCKEEAFDFVMYYNSQNDLLMLGESEGSLGKGGNTMAMFSTYEAFLKEQIYESEKPYLSLWDQEIFFTEEQKAQLKELIDSAVSDTAVQRDIYAMLMEEMNGYWQGGKDLDSACEILQNRASLYLKEQG